MMDLRFQHSPEEVKRMSTEQLRAHFLCENLYTGAGIQTVYTHYDRMIAGGVKPGRTAVALTADAELTADYFLERRELGIINVGGTGIVSADQDYTLEKLSCLYLGKGTREVRFASVDEKDPAVFFLLSATAHRACPNQLMLKEQASPVSLGSAETSNARTIYKYIHADGIESCQLVMGLTVLEKGSVWNSVPPHTHTRRTEVYFYFDLAHDQRIFHMMGEPAETRHLLMKNHEAVISPPWSVHFGCGTANYAFIWGMAGENFLFQDMDPAPVISLK